MQNDWLNQIKKDFEQERKIGIHLPKTDLRHILAEVREEHFTQFLKKGLPSHSDPLWQFTHIQNIFNKIQKTDTKKPSDTIQTELTFDFPNANQLVLHNMQQMKSDIPDPLQCCTWDDLNPSFPCWPDVLQCLQKKIENTDGLFHLSGAFPLQGYILFVPDGYQSSKALHIHSIFDLAQKNSPKLSKNKETHNRLPKNIRNIIFMGRGAQLTLIENISHYGCGMINAVTNVSHSENSNLQWIHVDQGGEHSIYCNHSISEMDKNSKFNGLYFSVGSCFSRNRVDVSVGEKAQCALSGLSILKDKNTSDHRFNIRHIKPGGYSRQFYRGILNDHSMGIFHGRVHIAKSAEGADCNQSAKNLLLSDHARACVQPELAIDCREVQAAHGGAIGSLNPDEIFYLQTRGLSKQSAWELLVFTYVQEVLSKFPASNDLKHLAQVIQNNKTKLSNIKK